MQDHQLMNCQLQNNKEIDQKPKIIPTGALKLFECCLQDPDQKIELVRKQEKFGHCLQDPFLQSGYLALLSCGMCFLSFCSCWIIKRISLLGREYYFFIYRCSIDLIDFLTSTERRGWLWGSWKESRPLNLQYIWSGECHVTVLK